MTGRLLTARVVADLLGVSSETVLRWVRGGRLPAVRLPGGAIRISEAQLDAWLAERATPVRGVRPTTADAAQAARYTAGESGSLPASTDATGEARGVASLVRPTTPRPVAAPEDEES